MTQLVHASGIEVPALKLTGGSPGAGKLLTSDSDGEATWQAPDFDPVYTGPTYTGDLDAIDIGLASYAEGSVTNHPGLGNALLLTMRNEDDTARAQFAYSITGTYAVRFRLGGSWGSWQPFYAGHDAWTDITGKPSTFTPATHSHAISDVTGLQTALDGKQAITPRVGTTTSSATPSINTDNVDVFTITALAAAITSMTTNLSGTPTDGQRLLIRIRDNGSARAITWGSSFQSSGVATLLATTVASKTHLISLIYDSAAAKWVCAACDLVGY